MRKEIKKIFIVEDDMMQAEMVLDHLSAKKKFTEIKVFHTGEEFVKSFHEDPDLVILDFNLSKTDSSVLDGMDLLMHIKKKNKTTEVIMFSGQDSMDIAINTMNYDAFDYIVKGETAFQRLDNTLYRLENQSKSYQQTKLYQILSITLLVIVACIAAVTLTLSLTGWTAVHTPK